MPTKKVPVKAGAPAVVVDKSGNRIRLRNIDHALPYCVSTRKGEIKGMIQPNQWTDVPDEVYAMLKGKFYNAEEQSFEVPDWKPGGENESAKSANRKEHYEEYTIEFPDESRR